MLLLALASILLAGAVRQECCAGDGCYCSVSAERGCCDDASCTVLRSSAATPGRPSQPKGQCHCCSADLPAWMPGGVSSPEKRLAVSNGVAVHGDAALNLKNWAIVRLGGSAVAPPVSPCFCVAFCRWQC